jgi:two-component system LytT family sensor kinase
LFSLVIAVLAAIPPLIRQNVPQFVINLIVLFGRILICWFIHHFFLLNDFRQGYKRPSGMRIFASCALATVIIFLIPILLKEDFVLGAGFSKLKTSQQWMVNLFRSAVISVFTYFVVYYNQVNLQLQKSRLENEYLKQDQLKAQLFSLQQQISPHFLFNSLSTLRTIAPDPMTKTYVMQLANVYRYLLAVHESPRITLQAELAFTESYLYILHERYENALQVSIGIEPALMQYFMPPLTLQILIENALKHNIISPEQPLCLRLYTHNGGQSTSGPLLTVENSYQPKPPIGESNGTGLQNIDNRYQLLAGRKIDVSREGEIFKVTLPLLTP